jgi:hypothetical protein
VSPAHQGRVPELYHWRYEDREAEGEARMSFSYILVIILVGLIVIAGSFAFSVWQQTMDLNTAIILLAVMVEGYDLKYLIEEKHK